MIKKLSIFFICILVIGLIGCSNDNSNSESNTINETPNIELVVPELNPEENPEENSSEPVLDEPKHSELYIADYSTFQILTYFEEVVLNMEYSDGTGDVTRVQKWLSPIYYGIYGSYTDSDLNKLSELFIQLNDIEGFPGIHPASDTNYENLSLYFLEPNDFTIQFSNVVHGEDAYGAAQFWYYTDTNELHTAQIGYRTDLDQNTRDSILLEEIVNVLGISDSELRTDSIVYQHSDENKSLSDIDLLILNLLYNPRIQCGMNFDQCAEIIKELYY